jgi:hypothetical protein
MYSEETCLQRIHRICDGFQSSAEGSEFYQTVERSRAKQLELPKIRKTASFCAQVSVIFVVHSIIKFVLD